MKKTLLLPLVCVCASLMALAVPKVNHAKTDMVVKNNTPAIQFIAPAMKMSPTSMFPTLHEFFKTHDINDNMLRIQNGPSRVGADKLIGTKLVMLDAYDWNFVGGACEFTPSSVEYIGGWNTEIREGENVGRVIVDGIYYSLPIDMIADYSNSSLTMPTGEIFYTYQGDRVYENSTYIDTTEFVMMVNEGWLNDDGYKDVVGEILTDGTVCFKDGWAYLFIDVVNTYSSSTATIPNATDTVISVSKVFRDTYLMVPNATHSYFSVYLSEESENGCYMYQCDDTTAVVWNIFGMGMRGVVAYIYPDGSMMMPIQTAYQDDVSESASNYPQYDWTDAENFYMMQYDLDADDFIHEPVVGTWNSTQLKWDCPTSMTDFVGDGTNWVSAIYFYPWTDNVISFRSGYGFSSLPAGIYGDGNDNDTIYILGNVTSMGLLNLNPSVIYSFAAAPPVCVANTFSNYSAELHVPSSAVGNYLAADYWRDFASITGDAVAPTEVMLDNDEVDLYLGMEQLQLTATVAPGNASIKTVSWSSSNPEIVSVNATGKVTAHAVGECDIVAKCLDKQAVYHAVVSEPTVLTFDCDSVMLPINEQMLLNVTITPPLSPREFIKWTSSNSDIATVHDGTITGVGLGECDIIAEYNGVSDTCHVTVYQLFGLELNCNSVTLEQNQHTTLRATVTPELPAGESVSWSSTNQSVATVNDGTITAVNIGECDVIAEFDGASDTCHVSVIAPLVHIALDKHSIGLLPNHISILTPIIPYAIPLSVTSTNPAVAVARLDNGNVQVEGKAEGTALIIVGSADGTAVGDTCVVTVYTERGDVNCDGCLDPADISALIDYLLNGSGAVSTHNADANNNGSVGPDDLSTLIDYLLDGVPMLDGETFVVNGVSFTMIPVDGGTFMMGATAEQSGAYEWEYPVHQVSLSSFSIGQTEVTQELWEAVMGDNPSYFVSSMGYDTNLQRPVESVTWDDCQEFIQRLNELTGRNFRLPTEAEWEFAARGGNKSKVYEFAGGNNIEDVAWHVGNSSGVPQSVATKAPNELGLYDMSGNVSEWCQDWYGDYVGTAQTNPTGPVTGDDRVFRGGGWESFTWDCRVSSRSYDYPYGGNYDLGLRLAL